jgi:hypothetical protein
MDHNILKELKTHAPFTMFGALTGIFIMFFFQTLPSKTAYDIFYLLHPLHVFLSALVTAVMYKNYKYNKKTKKINIFSLLFIGYLGSVGIATISDSLIPYLGEFLLDLPNRGLHFGFIEKWWLVNPLAVLGTIFAFSQSKTRFPHALHVLVSTWASLFHIIMALGGGLNIFSYLVIFIFLFFAVWLPCCVSDIVFPLLFISKSRRINR